MVKGKTISNTLRTAFQSKSISFHVLDISKTLVFRYIVYALLVKKMYVSVGHCSLVDY